MIPARYRVFLWAGLLLAVNLGSVVLIDTHGSQFEVVTIGYLLGSLYGHATLAASWAALGPGHALWRIPGSLGWIFLLFLALIANIGLDNGPPEALLVVGLSLLAQWIVLQVPLWALKAGLQAKLRYTDDVPGTFDQRQWQFGIRQLLIVTTIVGVVFGVGRLTVGTILTYLSPIDNREAIVFLFLACSAIFFSLPLLTAALLDRWTVVGVAIALTVIAVGTICEAPLIQAIEANAAVTPAGVRPNLWDLIAVNSFTSLLILLIAGTVRFNGYSLTRWHAEVPTATG